MVIEPTLLLQYPLPVYFFLRRDAEGRLLAQRIAAGMEIMIRDGSLQACSSSTRAPASRLASCRNGASCNCAIPTCPRHPALP
jgi:hypothetical protein